MSKNKTANRLVNEKSPYLLQHAYNPVDWYPWGEEAFAKAKAENKMVFLSIGYSTCHWCHVMAKESFEDEEVAEVLNKNFVSVKVDREERPDIDNIYMTACQALHKSGGWPLNVVMTPDKHPFFIGTYFPKRQKWGRIGLIDLLNVLNERWLKNKEDIEHIGNHIVAAMQQEIDKENNAEELDQNTIDQAFEQFVNEFDSNYGGFGKAPKFPAAHNLMFLLRYYHRTKDEKALEMVKKTLSGMRDGGIYDHLGYGFSRYSTDDRWLVPHFEKMLYDNALLVYVYIEAYQCTKDEKFSGTAEEIITYVLRDMTAPKGAFYSAEDADSAGEEGAFYVWTYQELIDILGNYNGKMFNAFYNVTQRGNFEKGKNVLNVIGSNLEEQVKKFGVERAYLEKVLNESKQKLFEIREKREKPFKDDKILTSSNALMIAALAKAGRVLKKEEYIFQAQKALKFIEQNLYTPEGKLLARYRDNEAAHLGYLDDHAFLMWALLEMYESTLSTEYLSKATKIADVLQKYFLDDKNGGFFFTSSAGEKLIVRNKEIYDGAVPSGNSVAAYALLKLSVIMNNEEYKNLGKRVFSCFSSKVNIYPRAYTFLLLALEYYLSDKVQIVIAGEKEDEVTKDMISCVQKKFLPEAATFFNDDLNNVQLRNDFQHFDVYKANDNKATAYICKDFSCQAPLYSVDDLERNLESLS